MSGQAIENLEGQTRRGGGTAAWVRRIPALVLVDHRDMRKHGGKHRAFGDRSMCSPSQPHRRPDRALRARRLGRPIFDHAGPVAQGVLDTKTGHFRRLTLTLQGQKLGPQSVVWVMARTRSRIQGEISIRKTRVLALVLVPWVNKAGIKVTPAIAKSTSNSRPYKFIGSGGR